MDLHQLENLQKTTTIYLRFRKRIWEQGWFPSIMVEILRQTELSFRMSGQWLSSLPKINLRQDFSAFLSIVIQ